MWKLMPRARGHLRGRRPTPAMVIALVALFVAMGGTAVAARHYLINSTSQINPKVLKKLKGNAGKGGLPGLAGVPGVPGAPGKDGATGKEGVQGKEGPQGPGAMWAVVKPEGAPGTPAPISRQSGGIAVTNGSTGGIYLVDFGKDVSRMMITATAAFSGDTGFRGTIISDTCIAPSVPPGFCGPNSQNFAVVVTTKAGDSPDEGHAFTVAAIGPTSTGPPS
jgi:hypothetical protein